MDAHFRLLNTPQALSSKMEKKQLQSDSIRLFKRLEDGVLCAAALPEKDDLDLYKITSPDFANDIKNITKKISSIVNSISSRYAIETKSSGNDSSSDSMSSLSPCDSLFDEISETTDEALEHYNSALDIARGIQKTIAPSVSTSTSNAELGKVGLKRKSISPSLDIEKPQIHFPDYPIDNSDTPFIPPNSATVSRKSSETSSSAHVDQYLQELFKKNSRSGAVGKHPYHMEIASSVQEMSAIKPDENEIMVYRSLKDTPCSFITTEEELFNMAERLKRVKEIAVDIENHSHRSFQGFICLLQISTRKEDFVIDALKLRGSIHRALAPIFTDESIVKVLHGANKDMEWLERDYGIYVVNMFDTGQAARVLQLPSKGLAYMLLRFCDIKATSKKKFQMADWRQRPLPQDMFEYARSDTHYLLYIYDRLRIALSKKNLLAKVWENSGVICLKRYKRIRYTPNLGAHLAAKHGLGYDRHQIRLLDEICKWRDRTAREEDESLLYVAPLYCLYAIAKARDQCRTVQGLLKCPFPCEEIPPLIKKHAEELARLVCDALDAKLEDLGTEETSTVKIISEKAADGQEIEIEDVAEVASAVRDELKSEAVVKKEVVKEMEQSLKGKSRDTNMQNKTVLPKVKVFAKKRSAFFDSDSESESEGEQIQSVGNEFRSEPVTVEMDNMGDAAKKTKTEGNEGNSQNPKRDIFELSDGSDEEEGHNNDRENVSIEKVASKNEEIEAVEDGPPEPRNLPMNGVAGEDLDSQPNDSKTGREKVAMVMDQLRAELAANIDKSANLSFSLEGEARMNSTSTDAEQNKVEEDVEVEVAEEKEEILSLSEAARRKKKVKKRRKKRPTQVEEDNVSDVAAYDYSNARQELQEMSKKRKKQSFHSMQRMKEDEGGKGTAKAVKKRKRGRAKMMSFRAKN